MMHLNNALCELTRCYFKIPQTVLSFHRFVGTSKWIRFGARASTIIVLHGVNAHGVQCVVLNSGIVLELSISHDISPVEKKKKTVRTFKSRISSEEEMQNKTVRTKLGSIRFVLCPLLFPLDSRKSAKERRLFGHSEKRVIYDLWYAPAFKNKRNGFAPGIYFECGSDLYTRKVHALAYFFNLTAQSEKSGKNRVYSHFCLSL